MPRKLAGDVDVEILDMHDSTKLDSPSGTAKEIGELVAKTRGESLHDVDRYGRQGRCPREHGEIAFHSIRGGDISSSHTTYFVGLGERLEIITTLRALSALLPVQLTVQFTSASSLLDHIRFRIALGYKNAIY